MRSGPETLTWLREQIRSCENTAEECAQELEDAVGCDEQLAKRQAFQEVLDFITERTDTNDTAIATDLSTECGQNLLHQSGSPEGPVAESQ